MKLYAHLFQAYGGGWTLLFSNSPKLSPEILASGMVVSGKREARRIAAEHNAICWNF